MKNTAASSNKSQSSLPSLEQMIELTKQKNHYHLLGIGPAADLAEIKKAYFDRVRVFHPDRASRNGWEEHKKALQHIVTLLTEAFETLSRPAQRRAYDAYLASRQTTLGARNSVPPREPSDFGSLRNRSSVPPSSRVRAATGSLKQPRVPSDMAAHVQQQMRARKERGASQVPPSSSRLPAGSAPRSRSSVPPAENRFVRMAEEAAADGAWASAVNMVKLALELDPNNEALQKRRQEIQFEADRALADKFLSQARYEEESREYARAARSYERAANGKRSAALYAKAAECMARDAKDPRKTVSLARNAMMLEQGSVDYRLQLARAYREANMLQSAVAETKRALTLDKRHPEAKALLRELKRS